VSISLGDVAEFVRGVTFKPDDVVAEETPGSIWCMRTKNVQGELDLSDLWSIDSSHVHRKEQYLRPGDILVSSANSWNLVGKCCRVPDLAREATFGGFIAVLRAKPSKIDSRYLYRWFSSPKIQATVRSFGRRTTSISNLNFERCLKLHLPVPEILEQERIAEILDQTDELRAKRWHAIALLDELQQSIFFDMFGNPVQNHLGFKKVKLREIAAIGTGSTPSRKDGRNFGGPIPWVKTGEVCGKVINGTEETLSELGAKVSRCKVYPPGSIIIALYGEGKTRGRAGLLGIPAATNQACAVIEPSPAYSTTFLFSQIMMSYEKLRSMARGGNQANLNLGLIGNFEVLLPDIDLQEIFSIRARTLNATRENYLKNLEAADELFTSIQGRAFRNEL
jgi:type I restriction enzyme S subunit